MYHHSDVKESSETISPSRFNALMKVLKDNGYHVISVEQFADFMHNKTTVPDNAVVITFDDGYETAEYKARVEEDVIAFPYGVYSPTVKQIEKNAGVTLFFTTKPGINKQGTDEIFRLNAGSPSLSSTKFLERLKKYR